MKKLMVGMFLGTAGLLCCGPATAQEDESAKAAEHVEQMAEELGEKLREMTHIVPYGIK